MHFQRFTDANSILPTLGAEFVEVVAFISMTNTDAISPAETSSQAIINCQFGSVFSHLHHDDLEKHAC